MSLAHLPGRTPKPTATKAVNASAAALIMLRRTTPPPPPSLPPSTASTSTNAASTETKSSGSQDKYSSTTAHSPVGSAASCASAEAQEETKQSVAIAKQYFGIDGFLLAALRNPKDRIFMLKLDKEMESFMKDPNRARLEFPQMNSYQRLVVHRVAAYFKLNHALDSRKQAIVLHKTASSEIPVIRLYDLVEEDEEPEVPQSRSTFKIMRRNNTKYVPSWSSTRSQGSIGGPPSVHSDSALMSHYPRSCVVGGSERKMKTLEEREAEYIKARARIFQESPGRATSERSSVSSASTSSSSSGTGSTGTEFTNLSRQTSATGGGSTGMGPLSSGSVSSSSHRMNGSGVRGRKTKPHVARGYASSTHSLSGNTGAFSGPSPGRSSSVGPRGIRAGCSGMADGLSYPSAAHDQTAYYAPSAATVGTAASPYGYPTMINYISQAHHPAMGGVMNYGLEFSHGHPHAAPSQAFLPAQPGTRPFQYRTGYPLTLPPSQSTSGTPTTVAAATMSTFTSQTPHVAQRPHLCGVIPFEQTQQQTMMPLHFPELDRPGYALYASGAQLQGPSGAPATVHPDGYRVYGAGVKGMAQPPPMPQPPQPQQHGIFYPPHPPPPPAPPTATGVALQVLEHPCPHSGSVASPARSAGSCAHLPLPPPFQPLPDKPGSSHSQPCEGSKTVGSGQESADGLASRLSRMDITEGRESDGELSQTLVGTPDRGSDGPGGRTADERPPGHWTPELPDQPVISHTHPPMASMGLSTPTNTETTSFDSQTRAVAQNNSKNGAIVAPTPAASTGHGTPTHVAGSIAFQVTSPASSLTYAGSEAPPAAPGPTPVTRTVVAGTYPSPMLCSSTGETLVVDHHGRIFPTHAAPPPPPPPPPPPHPAPSHSPGPNTSTLSRPPFIHSSAVQPHLHTSPPPPPPPVAMAVVNHPNSHSGISTAGGPVSSMYHQHHHHQSVAAYTTNPATSPATTAAPPAPPMHHPRSHHHHHTSHPSTAPSTTSSTSTSSSSLVRRKKKRGLLFDYDFQDSYEGVKPGAADEPTPPSHILEVYDIAMSPSDLMDTFPIPHVVSFKRLNDTSILAIFKNSVACHEALQAFPPELNVRIWRPHVFTNR